MWWERPYPHGLFDGLGPRTFGAGQDLVFLGKELAQGPNYSDEVAARIDNEIEGFLCKARDTATSVLEANRAKLTALAVKLLSDETLEGTELQDALSGTSLEEMPLAVE